MTLQTAIEKSIEGGWKFKDKYLFDRQVDDLWQFVTPYGDSLYLAPIASVVLDPAFWQALGKVEEWDESYFYNEMREPYTTLWLDPETDAWKMNMHRMIDALASGKTLVEYFATL